MVRVGIVGMGWIGKIHAKWAQTIKECQLIAVADVDERVLENAKQQYSVDGYRDYRRLLERKDIDAVYVATPVATHFQIVKDSLEAGKHVLCEKPVVLTPEEANSLRKFVKDARTKFMVNFPERYAISGQEAKLAVDQGLIGQVLYVRGNFRFFAKRHLEKHGGWMFNRTEGGGLILETSVHLWDAIRYWTGQEVLNVMCVAHETKFDEYVVEDNVAAVARLDGGAIACVDLSSSLPEGASTDKRFEIIGDKGCIYIDEYRSFLMIHSEIGYETSPEEFVKGMVYPEVLWHSKIEGGGGISRLQKAFVRCIEEDLEPSPSVEDGIRACEIAWAALKSLTTGRPEPVIHGGSGK